MPYGTPDGVASRARVWADDGHWVDPVPEYDIRGTNPSLTTVTAWLEQLSATMDLALQSSWFNTPVVEADSPAAYASIVNYVESIAADMAHNANGMSREVPPIGKIMKDMMAWVEGNEDGFLADGLTQTPTTGAKKRAGFRVIGTI